MNPDEAVYLLIVCILASVVVWVSAGLFRDMWRSRKNRGPK